MAKLIVSTLSSLDGYCAGPDGTLEALPMGEAFDRHNRDLMRGAGIFLFGANTYPLFRSFWPTVERGPGSDPVAAEISERFEMGQRIVVSDSLLATAENPWAGTEVVKRADAARRISDLKDNSDTDLLIFGSARLANYFLRAGLVDEFNLLVANVVLGEGVRTFEPNTSARFQLLDQEQLSDPNIVALRYGCY